MTEPTDPGPDQAPGTVTPKPTNVLAGLILAGVLVYNMTLDFLSDTYDGAYLSYGLIVGLCGVLGWDLARVFTRGEK